MATKLSNPTLIQGFSRTGVLGIGLVFASLQGVFPVSAVEPMEGANSPKVKVSPDVRYRERVVPFLRKYCLDCHGPEMQEGDVAFHKYKDAASVVADQRTWQKVEEMLASGAMPPDDVAQPTPTERKQALQWIDKTIYDYDCDAAPDPGRVTIRRLNRAEYNNTVRDLLGVDFRPADDFPSDDVGSGFDNIGDVLTLPPLLMEKYLTAAERIVEKAILAETSTLFKTQRLDRRDLKGEGEAELDDRGRRWSIISRGSVYGAFSFPRDGEYVLRALSYADQAGDEAARLELRLNDKPVKVFDVHAPRGEAKPYEIKVTAKQGSHRLSAHFLNDFYDEKVEDPKRRDRNLYILALELDGPVDLRPEDYPEMHRKLIQAHPAAGISVREAAHHNLRPFLSRAFRRKATDDEVARFAGLVERSVAAGDRFEQGMQVAIIGALVSPHFLFRVESHPKPEDAKATHEVQDFELASRLSYFLWSSMPDDELFALAASGQLRNDAVLDKQVRRMLADKRSSALVQNFATQWLNLRLLDGVTPDPQVFGRRSFGDSLKADMRRETEMFIETILREDLSILEFLDGKFTHINDRLARHYGIEDIEGDEFRRVSLADSKRAGILTHASILTLTSNPGRTSPVKRGKWILENILGSPPPDPPPDVPELETTRKNSPGLPLRKQLEIHRSNAVCASCHKTMDQLGFGLENYDAIGRWRERDGEFEIDSSGVLPGGDKFRGPLELAEVLKKRKTEFARCMAEKMLTFALGRGLMHYDRCATDIIVEALEKNDYRFSSLVLAIAQSEPFRKRRGDGGQP